jgi:hypothetical protein
VNALGNPPVRFDEGDVETELRQGYLGTARRKGRTTIQTTLRRRGKLTQAENRRFKNSDFIERSTIDVQFFDGLTTRKIPSGRVLKEFFNRICQKLNNILYI